MNSGTKRCPACGKVKPLDCFARDSRVPIGRASYCKACKRIKNRKYDKTYKQRRRKRGDMGWNTEAARRTHLAKDYSKSKFLAAMGMKNPQPIVEGTDYLVRCECGTCFSREEAADQVEYLPTIEEVYARAAKIREESPTFYRGQSVLPKLPGIREVSAVVRHSKLLMDGI